MGRRGTAGRLSRRKRNGESPAPQLIIPKMERNIPAYELLDAAGVELIHEASMRILEEIGVEFRDEEALRAWRDAGAEVSGTRVRISRELAMEKVALAPSEYVQHARNPKRSVRIGGTGMAFAPVYGAPYVRDLNGERRYARLSDFEDFVKLTYLSPALNHSGGTVCEPTDVPASKRHLDMLYSHIRYSDKPFMGGVTLAARARDCLDMCRILFGDTFVEDNTVMTSLINCNSPLVWDATMLSIIRVYAGANQACLISPFIMQGGNAPVTTAGAFAQLNAEALAGIAYTQLVRPGAPIVYGATLSTVSMQTGAPMYGTSEAQALTFLSGQLARRYGVPMRTGGMRTGSKMIDAQAAFESLQTMIPAIFAGSNFFLHSAGWLESGLSASLAKLVLDVDQLTVLQRLAGGIDLSADALAFDAIDDVGPGGHFLGCNHTLSHYETAFFAPETGDQNSFEQWAEEGEHDAFARATAIASKKLAAYVPPPLDDGVDEALRAFMDRRRLELPDEFE
jgi:trimethylamine---corrinoid protein Co-methyltransferase